MMGKTGFLLLFLCALMPSSLCGDEAYEKLRNDYDSSVEAWYASLQEMAEQDGGFGSSALPPHPAVRFIPRFKAFAQERAGKPEAIPALVWLIADATKQARSKESAAAAAWALDELTGRHCAQAALGGELPNLIFAGSYVSPEKLKALNRQVLAKNKDKTALSWATFALGFLIYSEGWNEETAVKGPDRPAKALVFFKKTVSAYEGTQAATWAASFVFELERLQVGMKAPDIVGTDVNEKTIRLSDFLGRVVVINFWGFW